MAHHSYRGIAQLVEQRSPKPRAEGSSPSAPAKARSLNELFLELAGVVELADTQDLGSCPNGCGFDPRRRHQKTASQIDLQFFIFFSTFHKALYPVLPT